MSYLTHLKRAKHHHSCRWIVKYDNQDLIREVKLISNPDEYRGRSGRNLHTINGLIKILENDKAKRNKILDQVQEEDNETTQKN